jgi:hypothetical protein
MKPVKSVLAALTNPIYQGQGFVQSTIIFEWSLIIGASFAQYCQPEKIIFPYGKRTGGRLYLKTSSSFAPEIQFNEPLIIDRINRYFGYRAVEKISISHKMVMSKRKSTQPAHPPLQEAEMQELEQTLGEMENTDLRQALLGLGVGVFRDERKQSEQLQKTDVSDAPKERYRWDGSKIEP